MSAPVALCEVEALLRDAYRTLGVVDVVIEEGAAPYAG